MEGKQEKESSLQEMAIPAREGRYGGSVIKVMTGRLRYIIEAKDVDALIVLGIKYAKISGTCS